MIGKGFLAATRVAFSASWSAGRLTVVAAGLSMLIEAITPALTLLLTRKIVDAVATSKPTSDLVAVAVGMALLLGVRQLLDTLRWSANARQYWKIQGDSRVRLLRYVLSLEPDAMQNPSKRDEISAALSSIREGDISQLFDRLGTVIRSGIALISTLWVVSTISPVTALIVLLSLIPSVVGARLAGRFDLRVWQEAAPLGRQVEMIEALATGAGSHRELVFHGAAPYLTEKSRRALLDWRRIIGSGHAFAMRTDLVVSLVQAAFVLIALLVLTGQASTSTAGDAAVLIAAIGSLGQGATLGFVLGNAVQLAPRVVAMDSVLQPIDADSAEHRTSRRDSARAFRCEALELVNVC